MKPVPRWVNGAHSVARLLAARVGGSPPLLSTVIYPTHRCNLRCTYCNSPFMKTAELTTGEWGSTIDELAALGCRRVAILGGEPLLRPDIGEIIARVRARGMACVLTSNGVLVPRHIERLRGLNTLILSLDAPGEANDLVRGEGVFVAVQEAIAAARAARVLVKLNAVLSAVTAAHLDTLLDFAARQDLSMTVNVMRADGADLYRHAASIKADDGAIQDLLERLAMLSRRHSQLLFSPRSYRYASRWKTYARDRVEAGDLPRYDPRVRDAPRCHAGRSYFTINPDGTVFPCSLTMNRIRGGNVAKDGVAAAWRSLRDHACVACFSPCMVEQNYLCSLTPSVLFHFGRRHLRRFA